MFLKWCYIAADFLAKWNVYFNIYDDNQQKVLISNKNYAVQLAILKNKFLFFQLLHADETICTEGFMNRADFLHEVTWKEGHQIYLYNNIIYLYITKQPTNIKPRWPVKDANKHSLK